MKKWLRNGRICDYEMRTKSAFQRKGANMYRVEWLDIDGEQKVVRGFKTTEEANEWIRTHHFDMDFEVPMVFYDG